VLRPSWQLSATIVALLLVAALVLRPMPGRRARLLAGFAWEFAIVFTLIGIWQYVGRFVHTKVEGAVENAQGVWDVERAMHLPSEVWVQQLVLPHAWLMRAMNLFYESVHFNSMWMFLIWLWWYHRGEFRRARTVMALTTLACLLVQAIPVAPPRMLPRLGFVDAALVYGQSVYGPAGSGIANQLSAMPSVHVAWAALLAFYGFRLCRNPWRWLFVAHFVITLVVVVATANHWWLDGLVAMGLMGLAILARGLAEQAAAAVRAGRLGAGQLTGHPVADPAPQRSGRGIVVPVTMASPSAPD